MWKVGLSAPGMFDEKPSCPSLCWEWGKPNQEKLLKAPLGDKLLMRRHKSLCRAKSVAIAISAGGKKGEKSGFGWILAFQQLSSPLIPKFKAVSFQGDALVMQEHRAGAPWRREEEKQGSPAHPRII